MFTGWATASDQLPGQFLASVRRLLPAGGSLPAEDWNRRHRGLLGLLWLNAALLPTYGVLVGDYSPLHTFEHTIALVTLAGLASYARVSPKLRAILTSTGLLTAAALLVHLTDGLIESHFYFFVLIVALTLYEDWLPFLLAVGYVLVHHGLVGTIEPHEVYNRPDAWANPWAWAGVHAFFVALAGAAAIVAWRLNENVRQRMQATQAKLARLSETDSLTGLGNRRKAMADLGALFAHGGPPDSVLGLFDLDGFKAYNDTFGHPAGDALLTRLGRSLRSALGTEQVKTYRLGGDEFCLLAPGMADQRATLEARAAAALSEQGGAFSVSASSGSVLIPAEAATPEEAMRLADQRMYAQKNSSRGSAMNQSKNVLLQALAERDPELGGHIDQVRELVQPVAQALGLPVEEIGALRHAAELHDIGKVAIPEAILAKPGPLNESEWEFIRRHTVIGQRIVAAAPALVRVGEVIRSSHERWDGSGYPDGLAGEEIPLAARIVSVCDAYDAMISDRPYRKGLPPSGALAELRRCAGSQFDPGVVLAFEKVMAVRDAAVVADTETTSAVAKPAAPAANGAVSAVGAAGSP